MVHLSHRHRFAGVSTTAIIYSACLLHYAWAFLLLVSTTAQYATPVYIIVTVFGGRYQAAVALIAVALLAQTASYVSAPFLPAVLVPQQVFLLLSAGAGLYAAAVGHFADGVQRGWAFILADKVSLIVIAGLYTLALISAGRWGE